MMPVRIGLLLIFLLGQLATDAQSVFHGRVIDAKTDEPLAFAHIYLRHLAKGTAADEDGRFSFRFTASAADTIVVSYMGYKTFAIPADKVDSSRDRIVRLEPSAISLDAVTVIGITPKELLKEALDNWDNNYFTTPTMQAGELKDWSIMNGEYLRFIDAKLELYRSTFNKAYGKKRQARHDIMMKITGGEVSSVDRAFDHAWARLQTLNMQINPYYFCYGLYNTIDKYEADCRVTGITNIEGREAYRLLVNTKKIAPERGASTQIAIYIDRETKAVVVCRLAQQLMKPECYPIRTKDSTVDCGESHITCDFSYRPFNHKWIIAGIYIKGNNKYMVSYSDNRPSRQLSVNSWLQFVCNDTKFENVKMPRSSECADQAEDIYKQIPTQSNTLIEREGKQSSRLDELDAIEQKEFGK
jgi:hypothetical protein